MTENDVNPHINNDPMEKRNEFIDHPSYVFNLKRFMQSCETSQTYLRNNIARTVLSN